MHCGGRIAVSALLAGAVVGTGIVAIGAQAHDAILLRRKIMKAVGVSAKEASEMAKGQRPFDAGRAATQMGLIASAWPEIVKLFPPGSDKGGRTRAAAEVWASFGQFEAEGARMAEDARRAAEAAAAGPEAFRAAFEPVAHSCKQCHVTYMTRD